MSEFNGTPGPWHVSFHGPDNCWVVDADKEAAVSKIMQYKGDGTIQKANFNVISAAPELLDVLINAREELESYEQALTGEAYNNPAINAAINKALGR